MDWKKFALVLLALAWLFAVTFNYYIVHKPFTLENALALIDAALNILAALALFALAAALGRRVLRAFDFAAPLGRIVFATGLGLGLISFATFALGLAGLLNPILFWFLLLTACCLLLTDSRALLADLRSLSSLLSPISRFERSLYLFTLTSLVIAFLYALTPSIAWDAQTYHLVIPKIALERGRIAAPPDNPYFSFPSLVEMLFLAAMVLKGDIAAQLIHFGFFLLLLGAVFAFATRYFNARVGWLACAILVAVPSLLLVAGWAYVDAALAFYAFGAFYLARVAIEKASVPRVIASTFASLSVNSAKQSRGSKSETPALAAGASVASSQRTLLAMTERENEIASSRKPLPSLRSGQALAMTHGTNWFALAGAFAGLAMGVKYTAVIVPIAVLFVLVISHWSFVKRNWLPLSAFCFLLSAFASPWYLRNFLFTGNPFYPFFFGGPNWDAFRANWFGRFGTGLLNEPFKLLTAPWDATIYGVEGALGYEATVGGLMLALVPLLLLPSPKLKAQSQKPEVNHSEIRNPCTARKGRCPQSEITSYQLPITDLAIFSLALYLFWLFGLAGSKLLQQTRLLFPAFAFFALFASIALERLHALDLPQFSLQRFARMLVALVLGLTLVSYVLGFASDNPLPYLAGAQTRSEFLAWHLGEYYKAVQFANQLPRDAKLLALWEPRAYYIRRAVQPDAILDAFPRVVAQTRDADAIARAWKESGYTHVLVNRHGLNLMLTSQYDPIALADAQVLQKILTTHARQVYGAPLEIVDGAIPRAGEEPYAIYELTGR